MSKIQRAMLPLLFAAMLPLTSMAQFASAPAFPGAEGYGRYVTGGRGGKVIHVTNLNDSGTGSLRDAIGKSGKRIIVFDVSGTIALKSAININKGDVTILGQTAPGDGICLANYALNFKANNIIVRYLRCRMGDYDTSDSNESDAMSGSHHDDAIKTGTIIDHCSVCWSIDECASFYGNKDFTFQWNYVTESMRYSGHSKGAHGYGGIWGGEKASFHHNLLAHHDSRNARIDHDYVSTLKGPIDYVNNVIYNWGGNNTYGGESVKGTGFRKVNFIGNYYKPGPGTRSAKSQLMNVTSYCTNCCKEDGYNIEPAHLYLKDNVITSSSSVTSNNWSGIKPDSKNAINVSTLKSEERFTSGEERFNFNTISIQPAKTAFDLVLKYGGCSFSRDTYDKRIAHEAETDTCTYQGSVGGTYGIIDKPSDVGGYPVLSTYNKLKDSDNDGMPDIWEEANGLNPNDASDASVISLDTKGYYTNIEVYANSIVEDDIKAQRESATESFEEYYPECKKIKIVTEATEVGKGTITWPLTSLDGIDDLQDVSPVISDGIDSYIDYAEASLGASLQLNGTVTDKDGMSAVQFKNVGSIADGTENYSVSFTMMPVEDINLNVTAIDFYAGMNSTNTASNVSVVYKSQSSATTLATAVNLPRITESNVAINALNHFSSAEEITSLDATGGGSISFYFARTPASKLVVLGSTTATIVATKTTTKTIVIDPTGIQSVKASACNANIPRKITRKGRLLIETANGTYLPSGARVR